jgi:hypothetical protein
MSKRRQKNRQPRRQKQKAQTAMADLSENPIAESRAESGIGYKEIAYRKIIFLLNWLRAQPVWFQSALALGIILRLYFVFFTQGTYDVGIWQKHAERINEIGLIAYYHENPLANHPPFISEVIAFLLQISGRIGIPFRVLLRLPFCLIDGGTVILLLLILRPSPRRLLIATAYWLNPLAILYSSYHGNTDSAVAFTVLLSAWLLSRNRILAGALALGAGLWIKLPVILAVPALLLLVDGWRKKLGFLALTGVTAFSTYLPAFLIDARVVWANVFNYRGQLMQTTAGVVTWGWSTLLVSILGTDWLGKHILPILVLLRYGTMFALSLICVVVWRRRWQRSPVEVCATIAISYTFIYAFSENWSFQYFAWSLPFWFFLPVWFPVLASFLAGGYIYLLYAYDCGNPFLQGKWDFAGHPYWPEVVIAFRDLTVLFFLASAGWFIIAAIISPKLIGSKLISSTQAFYAEGGSARMRFSTRTRGVSHPKNRLQHEHPGRGGSNATPVDRAGMGK